MIKFTKKIITLLCFIGVFTYASIASSLPTPAKYSIKLRSEIYRGAVNGKPSSIKKIALGKYAQINHKDINFSNPFRQKIAKQDPSKIDEEISIKPKDVSENLEDLDKKEVTKAKHEAEQLIKESDGQIEKENKEKLLILLKNSVKEKEENISESHPQPRNQDNLINLNKEELVLATSSEAGDKLSFSHDSNPIAKLFLASIQIKTQEEISKDDKENLIFPKKISSVKLTKKPQAPKLITATEGIINREYIVKRGDSFSSIFTKMGYDAAFILNLSKILIVDANFNPSKIQFGQKFIFTEKLTKTSRTLISLQIPSGLTIIKVQRDKLGKIQVIQGKREVTSKYEYKKFTIRGSLIASASNNGVQSKVIAQITRALSQKYDLSSQLSANDIVEIISEKILDKSGKVIDSGRLIYIKVSGRIIKTEAFSFDVLGNAKLFEFYDINATALKKSITNNPLNGRYRLTSGFGYRRHPVLGGRRFHAGVDYGAPTGTPIPAAGDGIIVKIGRYGGYGNYIRIKHDGVWQTAYGHMSRFASGMRVWRKVSKGEIIGYVGSTGRSTGPHLHLETLKYGKAIDPIRADLPSGKRLYGRDLTRFRMEVNRIKQILSARKNG
ncbi:MAG: peptidoglycan DD-metalloendopeptidase family protein [Rickettsiales bacterium]|nr:peptidoglycan DD-metalloendopeptidase family protein [Rickettsiales bacterium]